MGLAMAEADPIKIIGRKGDIERAHVGQGEGWGEDGDLFQRVEGDEEISAANEQAEADRLAQGKDGKIEGDPDDQGQEEAQGALGTPAPAAGQVIEFPEGGGDDRLEHGEKSPIRAPLDQDKKEGQQDDRRGSALAVAHREGRTSPKRRSRFWNSSTAWKKSRRRKSGQ